MSFQSVTIWDVESGERKYSWSYFDSNPYISPGVAFSLDGRNVVAADRGRVFVWNVESGKLLHVEPFQYGITCLAAQPGTGMVALCQKDAVILWNTETFKRKATLGPPRSTFPLSPELASNLRDVMKQANANLGNEIKLPEEPDAAMILNVDFSKDLRFVVTTHVDGSLRIWDVAKGSESQVVQAGFYDNIAINPREGSFATVAAENITIRNLATYGVETELVPPKTNQSGVVPAIFSRNFGKICPLRYSPDGLELVEGLVEENRLVIWDLRTRSSTHTSHASIGVPHVFTSSDHQQLYSVTGDVVRSL